MSYQATVIKTLVMSPSDNIAESEIILEVINDWNVLYSQEKNIVLMPAFYKTTEQPMKDYDIIAAAFWTRVGTDSSAQTKVIAHDIEEHVDKDKQSILFFSSQPVVEGSVNIGQYKAFKKFKQYCKTEGLFESYESQAELKEKFSIKLQQVMAEYKPLVSNEIVSKRDMPAEQEEETPVMFFDEYIQQDMEIIESHKEIPSLSETASELLKEASKDENGTIVRRSLIGGTTIKTNGKDFITRNDTGEIIRCEAAIRELEYKGLVKDKKHSGEIYQLTDEGNRVADLI